MTQKLLIADDQYALRIMLSELFSVDQFTVFKAKNGLEVLHRLEQTEIDLLLLDWQMPGPQGSQLLRQCYDLQNNLKVIIMSGYSEQEKKLDQDCPIEAVDWFVKPFDIEKLYEAVNSELCMQNTISIL